MRNSQINFFYAKELFNCYHSTTSLHHNVPNPKKKIKKKFPVVLAELLKMRFGGLKNVFTSDFWLDDISLKIHKKEFFKCYQTTTSLSHYVPCQFAKKIEKKFLVVFAELLKMHFENGRS